MIDFPYFKYTINRSFYILFSTRSLDFININYRHLNVYIVFNTSYCHFHPSFNISSFLRLHTENLLIFSINLGLFALEFFLFKMAIC